MLNINFKIIALGIVLLVGVMQAIAQRYETVVHDPERNWFNEGNPLPAEKPLILTGEIQPTVRLVRLQIAQEADFRRQVLERTWTRKPGNNAAQFQMPISFHLRSGKQYSFRLSYYATAQAEEVNYLRKQLKATLGAYLEGTAEVSRNRLQLMLNNRVMVREMDRIVEDACALFRTSDGETWPGFSEMIADRLQAIHKKKAKRSEIDSKEDMQRQRIAVLERHMERIIELVNAEVDYFFNREWIKRIDQITIPDYPVENSRKLLAVNAGYGATGLGTANNSLQYGSSFFAGISFPLTHHTNAPKLLQNSSFSTGVMFSDQEDDLGNIYRGPIIKTPIYAALGYKVFQFVRVNVGATVLEKQGAGGQSNPGVSERNFTIQPFVGLSAELLLWIGTSR